MHNCWKDSVQASTVCVVLSPQNHPIIYSILKKSIQCHFILLLVPENNRWQHSSPICLPGPIKKCINKKANSQHSIMQLR